MKRLICKVISILMAVIFLCPVLTFADEEIAADEIYEKITDMLQAMEIVNEEDTFAFEYDAMITEEQFNKLLENLTSMPQTKEIEMEFSAYVAVKKLIDLLGYTIVAEENGGYPSGYLMTARRLKISDGTDTLRPGNITVGQTLYLLYSSLNKNILEKSVYGTDEKYEETDETLLHVYKKIWYEEGILTDNGITGLMSKSTVKQGYIQIEDQMYRCEDQALQQMIGQRLGFYYREDQNALNRSLVYAESLQEEKRILAISSDDIISFQNGVFTYAANDQIKNIQIPANISVIYNNIAINTGYDETVFCPKLGSVQFIDNNYDGKYDVVIAKSYTQNIIVESTDEKNYSIKDFEKAENFIDLDETNPTSFCIYKADFTPVTFSYIEAFDVLSVAYSRDRIFTEIIISNKFAEGTIEAKKEDGRKTFLIGGKNYPLAYGYENLYDEFPVGDYCTFLLNYNREIVFGENETDGFKLGYIINGSQDESFSKILKLQILNAYSEIEVLVCASKITVDAVSVRDPAPLLSEKAIVNGAEVTRFKQQLIRYKLNPNGEIYEIDTQYKGATESADTLTKYLSDKNIQWRDNPKAFMTNNITILPSSGMKIFIVPPTSLTTENNTDTEMFKTRTITALTNDYLYNHLDAYTISEERISSCAIVTTEDFTRPLLNSYQGDYPLYLVQNMAKVILETGETADQICGITNNQQENLVISDKAVLRNFPEGTTAEPGDVVRVAIDEDKVVTMELIYRNGVTAFNANGSGSLQTKHYFKAGYVYSSYQDVLQLTTQDLTANDIRPENFPTDLESYKLAGTIYVCDNTRTVSPFIPGSVADILDFRHNGVVETIAVLTDNYLIKTIIVYK